MAGKQISDLTPATGITDGSLFVIEQGGSSKNVNWGLLKRYVSPDVSNTLVNSIDLDISPFVSFTDGQYKTMANGVDSSALLRYSDYIEIPENATSIIVCGISYNSSGNNSYAISPNVLFYDSSKNFITYSTFGAKRDKVSIPILDGAKYVIVNQPLLETYSKKYISFSAEPLVFNVAPGLSQTRLTDSNFTRMLHKLSLVSKPKTIYVGGGVYDIFSEYSELNLAGQVPQDYTDTNNYMPYNVIVPPNTHIIGTGKVTLKYEPTTSQTYVAESKIISPLNISGTATIENITVQCKNGRYAIHDESLGKSKYIGAIKKYRNVIVKKLLNDIGYGFGAAFGCGFDTQEFEFDGCEFYNENDSAPLYMHNRNAYESGTVIDKTNSGSVSVKNCLIEAETASRTAVLLGNVGSTTDQDIRMLFSNCHITGRVKAGDEGSSNTGNNPNSFDMTFVNCNSQNVSIPYAGNLYPYREFNVIS